MSKIGSKQGSSNKKVANSLVAASASAVLAVYAAGYARTRSAADQLEAQSEERRPGSPEGRGPASATPASPTNVAPSSVASDQADTAIRTQTGADQPLLAESTQASPVAGGNSAPATASITQISAQQNPATDQPEKKPENSAVPSAPPVQMAVNVPPPAPQVVPAPPAPQSAVATSAAPEPAPAAPPAPKWKDGTYTGWGTSRHGDIQASVVIENGRIVSANISQCLTRYSCNVIGRLPPEVPQRQSAEVDYVSGATQSTNAYYYAVTEALGKAK